MSYEVVIPWRTDSSPERRLCLDRVERHLLADGAVVHLATPPGPWSPGAARNHGVLSVSSEVVIFNDADTIVPHEQIRRAEILALATPGLVWTYELYLRRDHNERVMRELWNPPSMNAAIRVDCFRELGGFSEWPGWGYEDLDFARRASERWPLRRVAGVATHLDHGLRRADDSPFDADEEQARENRERWLSTV